MMIEPRYTAIRVLVIGHVLDNGRTSADDVAEHCMGHVRGSGKNKPEAVRRTAARQLLRRLDGLGLVRMYRDESVRVTAAGRRYFHDAGTA